MPDDWPTRFTALAAAKVDRFIAEHPGFTRDGVAQPGQGGTNRVLFARRGGELVVFKVFCEPERKARECFGLRHWRPTGLVPDLLHDVDETMIVTTHVAGTWLHVAREAWPAASWSSACRDTGRAIGSLTRVPLNPDDLAFFESRFYGQQGTFESYLRRILELGRAIHVRDPDFQGDFWRGSLRLIAAELDALLAAPRVLYHQDVGNLHVRDGRFSGVFDLEMCRPGCAAMQLGAAMQMFESDLPGWLLFREGWEAGTGSPLTPEAVRAAAVCRHLLGWREISRYLSYDGTPGTGYAWADPADPVRYRKSFEAVENLL